MYTCSFAQHYQTARLVESFGVFPRRAVRHTHTARVWDVTGRSPSMDARSRAVRLPAARPRRPLHYNSTGSGSIGCGFKHRLRSRFTRRYCGNHGCCLVLRSLICLSSAGSPRSQRWLSNKSYRARDTAQRRMDRMSWNNRSCSMLDATRHCVCICVSVESRSVSHSRVCACVYMCVSQVQMPID
jgi:hypothetical protein